MKKLLLLLPLAMLLAAGPVHAANVDFTAQDAFINNIFTDAAGISLTVEYNAVLKGWDSKGLQVQLANDNHYVKLAFSAPVQLEALRYQGGANGAVLLAIATDQKVFDPIAFVPGQDSLDLSAYGNITSVTIIRGDGVSGVVGTFSITGLAYNGLSTPIPAAAVLFGSGLAGLAALRRKLR